ncbi:MULTISPECIES: membrane protein insertase YidC [Ramlibacter]|uniref:Membrane protein insertase YidC n=1 Tax=Ramlibacter aquaticus TaxID=2780094 RepID=A0ABR9SGZ5_9BURK|nr:MULTISPECIES: membrane protein insertase YidC [Ramlibacter]MBE7941012.1 membrane protein insertase YidC [Ramlibacter aquaticus]
MTDIRRTILWVIFGFSMVLLWDQWQVYNGRQATFFPQPNKVASATAAAKGGASSVPAPTAGAASAANPAAVPGAPAGATGLAPAPAAEKVVVTTDLLKLTFDTEGGSLIGAEFLKQENDQRNGTLVLLSDEPGHTYVSQTGLIGGDFPNHKTVMAFSGERQLKDGQDQLVVRFESPEKNGVKLVKTYTLRRGAYDIAVRHEVVNTGTVPVSPQLYLQIVRDGTHLTSGSSFYSTFTGPAVYTDRFQKVTFADIDKDKADFQKKADTGYVAMVQHYFASAWILPQGIQRDYFMRKIDAADYAAGMITPLESIAPGATKVVDAKWFAGPEDERMLEKVAPGLDYVKDYGKLYIIAKPLYWLLSHIHAVIGNWGWSIMALVLLIKVAFYWPQAKGYQSMAKMKAINPRVMALRERLKDKPQEMQQEMMKIYREEKVNPMGGCLPVVIQIPVFISLYWVLLSSVEMRGQPWVGWIHDLSVADPYFILPAFMTLTTLLQTALNPAPPDPVQAKMMWIMPLAFSVMFFFFPAGLVLYWITNNLLSIAQQWLINTRMGVPPQFNLPKFR